MGNVERITSHGTGETLLERVKTTNAINVRGGHWEEAEEFLKADLCLVVDDPESFYFGDQTPLWHHHKVMFSHTGGDDYKGRLYFSKWEGYD